ncbi:MAG: hypothetical protein M3R57_07400 [Chloroflexota bacterium]|nr:hypothetical protein [Chloroflexota bacterium]
MSEARGRSPRSALERLVPELAPPDNVSPVVSTFLRGLALGALAGAALAGSALLQRRRAREAEIARESSSGIPEVGPERD